METFSAYKLIQEVQWDFSAYEEINHSDLRSTLLRGFRLSEKYLIYLSCISGPCVAVWCAYNLLAAMSQIHPEQQLNFVLATFNKDKEM